MSRKRKISEDESSGSENDISWFDMPLEMRELVIDEMDIVTKCKFAQCSKKCEDEVKISKKFLTRIKLYRYIHPEIYVGLGESSNDQLYPYTYCLKFRDLHDENEPKFDLIYKTDFNFTSVDRKWTERRNGDAEEASINYLNELLKTFGKTIESFEIDDKTFVDSKFDMKQLTNLSYLRYEWGDIRKNGFMELSQISQIENCYLNKTQFTFEEVLQFKGSIYHIRSDDFDNEHIERYFKMLKNGEVHRNMAYLDISSKFRPKSADCKKLAKSVDGFDFYGENEDCCFRFLLNYERKQKCYCYVEYSPHGFSVEIKSHDYDRVMKNRQPLID